jgi:hypothetical protein
MVVQDFLSPRENTDAFYICFTWQSSLQNNTFPYLYPRRVDPLGTSFLSLYDTGSVYVFLMGRDELTSNQLIVAFDGNEADPRAPKDVQSPPQLVKFSWEPVELPSSKLCWRDQLLKTLSQWLIILLILPFPPIYHLFLFLDKKTRNQARRIVSWPVLPVFFLLTWIKRKRHKLDSTQGERLKWITWGIWEII